MGEGEADGFFLGGGGETAVLKMIMGEGELVGFWGGDCCFKNDNG